MLVIHQERQNVQGVTQLRRKKCRHGILGPDPIILRISTLPSTRIELRAQKIVCPARVGSGR